MADLKHLTERAMQIHHKYLALQKKQNKPEWNESHIMEGFVGDMGDLMKIIMAKKGLREIEDVDKKLAHELSDCLWSILVLSEKFGIDLEKSFLSTMNELDQKINS